MGNCPSSPPNGTPTPDANYDCSGCDAGGSLCGDCRYVSGEGDCKSYESFKIVLEQGECCYYTCCTSAPTLFDATAVLDFGGRVAGAIKLAIRAINTKQAALFVGFPPKLPLTDNVPVSILIDGGEYVSDTFFGVMVGPNKATVTMCGGEVYGGNDGPGYPGVGLMYGGAFNMAGGHIVGAITDDGFEHFGAGLMLYPDAALDTFPTATITGGTITGGSFLAGDGNYRTYSVYAGSNTAVHLAGGKLFGDLYVGYEGTVFVYGEKHLSYEEVISNGITYRFLNGKLCDGSELGNITVSGGGHVELKDCDDAPKIDECGKKAKSGKDMFD